jgi:serine/threonine-protein kinase SRPK3
VPNSEGKLCQTAREYYGGPFFNSEGGLMRKDLIPTDVRLEDSVLFLIGEDKRFFLDL